MNKEISWLIRDKYHGKKPSEKILGQDLACLKAGEPIDYVIGWKEFLGCKIDLSAKPLIPREETEFWVGEAIKEIKKTGGECLDLFAGSGCIGLAVLKHCPKVRMTFGDSDEKFVKQIRKNLKTNKLKAKVIKTDVFSKINGRFSCILANPPYVSIKGSRVQKSVKDWEPKGALFAGPDGLTLIKKFLKEAKDHLKPKGSIYLEFGQGQKTAINKLLQRFGYVHREFHKDQFGRSRWVVVEW